MDDGVFLDVCIVCFSLLLLMLSLFILVFISGQIFVSSSKDAATMTVIVELIIRAITVLLLLTLMIIYYSQELPVQYIFKEQLSIQHRKISTNGHATIWK